MSLFKKFAVATIAFAFVFGAVGLAMPMTAFAQATTTASVVVPVGYEKIPGPSKISQYTDIIKFPGSIDLYGKPRSVAAKPVVRPVVQAPTTVTTVGTSANLLANNTLSNLLLLDSLFNDNSAIGSGSGLLGGGNDLGDLFLLNRLFTGEGVDGGIFNGSNGNGSGGGLGDLLILDAVFGNKGGLLDGGSDLGDLIILDMLFGTSTR